VPIFASNPTALLMGALNYFCLHAAFASLATSLYLLYVYNTKNACVYENTKTLKQ